jgi:hypothetical protein
MTIHRLELRMRRSMGPPSQASSQQGEHDEHDEYELLLLVGAQSTEPQLKSPLVERCAYRIHETAD